MDGISNYIQDDSFKNIDTGSLTVSAWVAPRVFENNFNPEGLTCIVGKGDVGFNEGWLLGYGYLGTWGLKVALEDPETGGIYGGVLRPRKLPSAVRVEPRRGVV